MRCGNNHSDRSAATLPGGCFGTIFSWLLLVLHLWVAVKGRRLSPGSTSWFSMLHIFQQFLCAAQYLLRRGRRPRASACCRPAARPSSSCTATCRRQAQIRMQYLLAGLQTLGASIITLHGGMLQAMPGRQGGEYV